MNFHARQGHQATLIIVPLQPTVSIVVPDIKKGQRQTYQEILDTPRLSKRRFSVQALFSMTQSQ
jgi:hypothetical protein